MDWLIKKNLAELLLYIELNEDDLFYSRLKSFKRRFTDYLKQIAQLRILKFLYFAEHYYLHPESVSNTDFKNKIELAFSWTSIKKEDIFVISFYAWLKNKIDKSSLYQTTIELIHRN
jgi:hypothetical protein